MSLNQKPRDPPPKTLIAPAMRDRRYDAGDWVQVRSGGAPMQVVGYEGNGDALCRLGDRTFAMPQLLLRPVSDKPQRRGRKPGISPAKLPAPEPALAGTAGPPEAVSGRPAKQ
ncbi:MAG: hypothetical protein Q8O26_00655 [Phreatobacter sp.]|uniref:hypothetical protein n=1 Tax=Phreatobacter sp. TaxID=1966341 RepID=UPI002733907F|nr:hypothetical protein [Phreatobacter sp.]MDP2800371.1 hypothetical protein [Phreatobacter sp.]